MDEPRHHDECYACPVGGFFLTARGASPEAFEHLMNAAAELAAAARTIVEAAERLIETQRNPAHQHARHGERIQFIRIADE
jgi:hypothetical protein